MNRVLNVLMIALMGCFMGSSAQAVLITVNGVTQFDSGGFELSSHVRDAASDDGDNDPDNALVGSYTGDTSATAMQVCNVVSDTYNMPAYEGKKYLGYFQDAALDFQKFNLATPAVVGDAIHAEFETIRLNAADGGYGGTVYTFYDGTTTAAAIAESWNGWDYYYWGGSWYDDYQFTAGQGKLTFAYNQWQKIELDWVVGDSSIYVSIDGDQKVMSSNNVSVTQIDSLRFLPWNGASWAAYDSVPEPATMGLVALGGAMLLRRRK